MADGSMNLQQIRALLAVSRSGSISAAARAIGITQPVLSRTVKQLERQLGVTLLHRSARGATLTEYGVVLVARAQRIDQEVRRSREEIEQMRGSKGGLVSIACSPVPMMLFMPKAIGLFRRTFPRVEIRIAEAVYPQVMQAFQESRLDFGVGPVPTQGLGRDFKVDKLLSVELVAVVKRGHRSAGAVSLAALQDEEWIVMGPHGGPGAIVAPIFQQQGLSAPLCVMYVEPGTAALEMIKHTNLVGFVPRPIALAAKHELQIVPVKEKIEPLTISIFMHKQSILTPASQALVSAIRSVSASWNRTRR